MSDEQIKQLCTRLTAGALVLTSRDASPGEIAMACASILAADGYISLKPEVGAALGQALDDVIHLRSEAAAMAKA